MTKIPISDINMNIETRFRQNLGELQPLIESIKRHGLLHPIVLSEDNQLICGRRRLAAYMQLEYTEIEATYTSSPDLREAEADEHLRGHTSNGPTRFHPRGALRSVGRHAADELAARTAPGARPRSNRGDNPMSVTIYHNPDCGTSRNTLAIAPPKQNCAA